MISLYPYQERAVEMLKTGSILNGGVGSGKSITSLWYYYTKVCKGDPELIFMEKPTDLYIITTARKRDTAEWEMELAKLCLSRLGNLNPGNVKIVIDSWNNIPKYTNVTNAFFIFDEQRVIGYGTWTKAFLKITKNNQWILLSATPGDTWMDYAPVFIANGFYKNKRDFVEQHVIFEPYRSFPKIKCYVNCSKLVKNRDKILVNMDYEREFNIKVEKIICPYEMQDLDTVVRRRWNIYDDCPIKNSAQLFYYSRRVINETLTRMAETFKIYKEYKKIIVFYNFNYELELLLEWANRAHITVAQWNGQKHENIPNSDEWVYLVQYSAGAEGWNCIETNVIVFYSLNHSYKQSVQAAGRINRCNSPFNTLYYFVLMSDSFIDKGIVKALSSKKDFNLREFEESIEQNL